MEVVVPDDQLSLAIGKRGQNVRLASRLTGWKLDVTSESHYSEALKENYMSLIGVEGVGEKLAGNLFEEGFRSARDLAGATVDELMSIGDIPEEDAQAIIQSAGEYTPEKNTAPEEGAAQESENTVTEDDEEGQPADEESEPEIEENPKE
jgi:transcription termination/antitermination protein NusA